MLLIKFLILFFSAFVGGISVFFIKDNNAKRLKLLLSFSGAYLFAICTLHLMPEVFASPQPLTGVFVLIGFCFQIILEQYSKGVEHGHVHHSHNQSVPFSLMISLCLHAFLEAIPLAKDPGNELLSGIALHHVPAAFALGALLKGSSLDKKSISGLILIFALMSPFGLLLGDFLNNSVNYQSYYLNYIMALVVGIFLHISTTILFESEEDHKFNKYKLTAITLGLSIALILFFTGGGGDH